MSFSHLSSEQQLFINIWKQSSTWKITSSL